MPPNHLADPAEVFDRIAGTVAALRIFAQPVASSAFPGA
jgi:hypothetical protein